MLVLDGKSTLVVLIIVMTITTDQHKRASFLNYCGSELQDVFDSLHDTGTTYVEMKAALEACFDPKSKSCYQTLNFQHCTN